MNPATVTVPCLPADDIRRAIAADDWTRAGDLMSLHQHELAAAMGQVDWSSVDRGPWLELLLAQRDLMSALECERAQVAEALTRLNNEHRGARAWLRELA